MSYCFQIQSVMIMTWTSAYHEFVSELLLCFLFFFKLNKFVIATTFCAHFMLLQNDTVLDTMYLLLKHF